MGDEDEDRRHRVTEGSETPLSEGYDVGLFDLDGVLYVGSEAVPHAADELADARGRGMRSAFITNNAARTPEVVAEQLRGLGIPAGPAEVVTSAQAAARVLRERLGEGSRVAVLGTTGLIEALAAAGLVPVGVEEDARALVSGYAPDVAWRDVMRAAVRIRDGLWWVASNTDMTIPMPFGEAPGHGVLVQALRSFSGVEPVVAGKPQPPLLEEARSRTGAKRALMIGDRLDTDIAGAVAVGIDSLLVLTGVSGLEDVVSARPEARPSYIAPDLRGLNAVHPVSRWTGEQATAGGWSATVTDGRLVVAGEGDPLAWWRVVADVAWRHLDRFGAPVDVAGSTVPDQAAPTGTGSLRS